MTQADRSGQTNRSIRSVALASIVALLSCAPTSKEDVATDDLVSDPVPAESRLRVKSFGVAGFLIEHGGDAILTAPLFTRASLTDVYFGAPVTSDPALVAHGLPSGDLAKVRAVVSGHAHYDHLLDVPAILALAPQTRLYSNRSAKNLLAAYAPDRAPACAGTPAQPNTIARSRVVAFDDPAASVVDYTNCPSKRPPNAPLNGSWVRIPDTHVRILAVCSEHPDQFGTIHFGAGNVDQEQCTPPKAMDEWREGMTLAYLVDFLDPGTDAPVYRVYYQDAPTNKPIGHIPAPFLAEKRVDLALLCVGSYQNVDGGTPANTINMLSPRYALGGHWEDFFVDASASPNPLPFTDPEDWRTKATAAVGASSAETKMLVRNGQQIRDRAVIPQPGDAFEIVP